MNAAYLTAIDSAAATGGAALITHIGLFDSGVELSGGSPAYARLPVTWTLTGGEMRPNADLDFDAPTGVTVDEWRGFSASTGGTDYGGSPIDTPVTFAAQGVFRLVAADTAVTHTASVV